MFQFLICPMIDDRNSTASSYAITDPRVWNRDCNHRGWAAYLGGFLTMIVGFWMRSEISGRAPVTNMYESVIYLGLGTTFFGLIFELFHRKRYILTAAAGVAMDLWDPHGLPAMLTAVSALFVITVLVRRRSRRTRPQ